LEGLPADAFLLDLCVWTDSDRSHTINPLDDNGRVLRIGSLA